MSVPGLLLAGGRVLGERCWERGWVAADGGAITATGPGDPPAGLAGARVDLHGLTLLPGFIDVHVHGGDGRETMDADPEALRAMARFYARHGVTAFLASTWTASRADTLAALRAVAQAVGGVDGGATLLGAHLEGPYLSPRRCGAQDPAQVRPVDRAEARAVLDTGVVRLLTLAPELPDADWLIDECRRRGIRTAIGHSDATYEQALAAVDRGVTHVTHTYNAMSPLHHRAPGVVGAALICPQVSCEVIADGVHVHPGAVDLLLRSRGADGVVLVTDAVRAAGAPEGQVDLGGRRARVRDGAVRLPDGSLAGSTLTMDAAVRNALAFTGRPLAELWPSSSRNAAVVAGVADRKGSLAVGRDADLTVLDGQGMVVMTVVAGRVVHRR